MGVVKADESGNFGIGEHMGVEYVSELLALNLGATFDDFSQKDGRDYLMQAHQYFMPYYTRDGEYITIGEAYGMFCDALKLHPAGTDYEQKVDEINFYNTLGYNQAMPYEKYEKLSELAFIPVEFKLEKVDITGYGIDVKDFNKYTEYAKQWNEEYKDILDVFEKVKKSKLEEISYNEFSEYMKNSWIVYAYARPYHSKIDDDLREYVDVADVGFTMPDKIGGIGRYHLDSNSGEADGEFKIKNIFKSKIGKKVYYTLVIGESTSDMYRYKPGFIIISDDKENHYNVVGYTKFGPGSTIMQKAIEENDVIEETNTEKAEVSE